jgi:hypothetical protein
MESIDSIGFVVRAVRCSVGDRPGRMTVRVSSGALAEGPGRSAVALVEHPGPERLDVCDLVLLAALDHGVCLTVRDPSL